MANSVVAFIILGLVCTLQTPAARGQSVASELSLLDTRALLLGASEGRLDPDTVLAVLSEPRGLRVSMMKEILALERGYLPPAPESGQSAPSRYNPTPAYELIVKAMGRIGSMECYLNLVDAAEHNSDPEVRGYCLSSLARVFPAWAKRGSVTADPSLVYLFLIRSSDTLTIRADGLKVGEIARVGLRNWTSKGSAIPISSRLFSQRSAVQETVEPYWRHWWSTRSRRIAWDPRTGSFFLPR